MRQEIIMQVMEVLVQQIQSLLQVSHEQVVVAEVLLVMKLVVMKDQVDLVVAVEVQVVLLVQQTNQVRLQLQELLILAVEAAEAVKTIQVKNQALQVVQA
tara:strand:+ start:230 stop:529 length:300 start_codon:yes stop_codon:yes gene_type:complete